MKYILIGRYVEAILAGIIPVFTFYVAEWIEPEPISSLLASVCATAVYLSLRISSVEEEK